MKQTISVSERLEPGDEVIGQLFVVGANSQSGMMSDFKLKSEGIFLCGRLVIRL